MLLRVGQTVLRGDVQRYARNFDLLELRAEPGRLPRLIRLRDWASRVPAGFVFSVELPRQVAQLDSGPAAERSLGYALRVAEALGAGWLVLRTPASVRPSAWTRRRLAELVGQLPRQRRIAWEPGGLWEQEEAERLASGLELHLVRDLTRAPPAAGQVVYSRLRPLGGASRLGAVAAERVGQHLLGRREAFVVIESHYTGRSARLVHDTLRQALEVEFAPRGD
jgi:uncharacterized protein YecE (DUF72 family)